MITLTISTVGIPTNIMFRECGKHSAADMAASEQYPGTDTEMKKGEQLTKHGTQFSKGLHPKSSPETTKVDPKGDPDGGPDFPCIRGPSENTWSVKKDIPKHTSRLFHRKWPLPKIHFRLYENPRGSKIALLRIGWHAGPPKMPSGRRFGKT